MNAKLRYSPVRHQLDVNELALDAAQVDRNRVHRRQQRRFMRDTNLPQQIDLTQSSNKHRSFEQLQQLEFEQQSAAGNIHRDNQQTELPFIDQSAQDDSPINRYLESASPTTDPKTPEEVYVWSTCCNLISGELKPSIAYMPALRGSFFLFNFLTFAFGLADLGMGLWFRIDPKVYEIHKYIETQNFTYAGWIMLFGGFIACLISLFGFAAASRELAGALLLYALVCVVLSIGFVGAVVLLTVYGLGSSLERFLVKEIYEQIRRRSMSTELDLFALSDSAQFLDFVQVKMRCCGATDFQDYGKLGMVVPATCYTIDKNFVQAPGCGRAIRNLLDIRAGMASGFVSGSIVSQLIALSLAMAMFCSIYHSRAIPRPRPMTPTERNDPRTKWHRRPQMSPATPTIRSPSISSEHSLPHELREHRPRSRTPIAI